MVTASQVVTALQVVMKKIASWLVGEDRIGGGDRIAGSGEEGMVSVYMKVPAALKLGSGLGFRYGLNRGLIEPLSEDIYTRKDIHGKKTYAERGEGTQTEGGYPVTRFHGEAGRRDTHGEGTDTGGGGVNKGWGGIHTRKMDYMGRGGRKYIDKGHRDETQKENYMEKGEETTRRRDYTERRLHEKNTN